MESHRVKVPLTVAILSLLLAASPSSPAQEAEPRFVSAWEVLVSQSPALSAKATPAERQALQRMTLTQAQQFRGGIPASAIVLSDGETLESFLAHQGVETFDLGWFSLGGGGGVSSGAGFSLHGVLGGVQPEEMTGGSFSLVGGFIAATAGPGFGACPGNSDGIFCDGFESGDLRAWASAVSE